MLEDDEIDELIELSEWRECDNKGYIRGVIVDEIEFRDRGWEGEDDNINDA